MKRRIFIMVIILLGVMSVHSHAQGAAGFDLEKLLVDVFDPQPGEKVLVVVDQPHEDLKDNPEWADRREMAAEWQVAFQELAAERGFDVLPMLSFSATGAHNGPLPEYGEVNGKQVSLAQVFANVNIIVALTEYSATAPLIQFAERYPNLRAASMPMVSRSMQETALRADYKELAHKCRILWERLDRAEGAQLEFSTGHQLYIDLREREAELDDGRLNADKQGSRVINLPSGEAYIAPYEGEIAGQPSLTRGEIPILMNHKELVLQIEENRVVRVQGEGDAADELRGWLGVDPARTNVAELGLGCNDQAVVTGNVLEDEKVFGVHLAAGRSDHIGGSVGADSFEDPSLVVHQDVVYPQVGDLTVVSVVLEFEDGTSEEIIQDGEYTVFDNKLTITSEGIYFLWLFLVAGSLNFLAWDTAHGTPTTTGVKLAWAFVILVLGPFALLVYLLSYRKLRRTNLRINWRRALGASAYRAALFALWLVMVIFVFVFFLPEPSPLHILSLSYLLPILLSLFALGAPYTASRMGCGYWKGVRRAALSEFIIQTLTFAGIFPTFFYVQEQWLSGSTDITNPLFWISLPISALVGAIILYPFLYWVARRGFFNWSFLLVDGSDIFLGEDNKILSIRNAWGLLLLSIILFASSIGLMVIGLS